MDDGGGRGSVVRREALNELVVAVGRDMACGCVDVKRVNVSEGACREAIAAVRWPLVDGPVDLWF